jgi:D-alanyl-D-alanine carboxypeptidase/D-alanyl-D-alanine-endopeptidase (penicillin-binding protein 4)
MTRAAMLLAAALALGAPCAAAESPPPQHTGGKAASEAALHHKLRGLIRRGGAAVAVNGETRFIHGPGRYVPASILKLATALAALDELGPDFHFQTEVYLDAANVLYIRGLGDPFLVSEEWRRMGQELARMGVFELDLKRLVLDTAAFDPDLEVDGVEYTLNPYDARPGALVTNFNTINLMVLGKNRVHSAEPQTPLTALGRELAKKLNLRPGEQRINLSRHPANGPRYSGEVALAVFREQGAHIKGGFGYGTVPAGLAPLLIHRSESPLTEVIAGMLEFSNNFIANQLLLQIALKRNGPPARLTDGVEHLRGFLVRRIGLDPASFHVVEGSGISRANRIDLEAMLKVTDAFYPWRELMRVHQGGSRAVLAKTGTLKGVYSLAGFLPAPPGERRAFVVMENQRRFTREQVLNRLLEAFAAPELDAAFGP